MDSLTSTVSPFGHEATCKGFTGLDCLAVRDGMPDITRQKLNDAMRKGFEGSLYMRLFFGMEFVAEVMIDVDGVTYAFNVEAGIIGSAIGSVLLWNAPVNEATPKQSGNRRSLRGWRDMKFEPA